MNVSSVAGHTGFKSAAAYVASKHGVIGLTKSAALDYANDGIRVNAICPGVTKTPLVMRAFTPERLAALSVSVPGGRLGEPEDMANAIAWLCSDEASFVNGQCITLDGGWTVGREGRTT